MRDSSTPEDALTLEGVGGLFNGEVYVLKPGQSASVGSSSLASFSVTVCRNYLRLRDRVPLDSVLERMAPEHLRFVYVGEGRLIVENLVGRDARVGRRPFERRSELDLTQGRVEIGFGYGERIVASVPRSPPELVEFAPPRDDAAEVEGVFMALLAPGGPLASRAREEAELTLGPPTSTPPPPGAPAGAPDDLEVIREEPRRRSGRRGLFRSSPPVLLSALFHAVVILGLFSYLTIFHREREPRPTEVTVVVPESYAAEPEPEPQEPEAAEADPTISETGEVSALPDVSETEAGSIDEEPSGLPHDGQTGPPGEGLRGLVGIGPGGASAVGGPTAPRRRRPGRGGAADAAIERGLQWLVEHRLEDGSWAGQKSLACGECSAPAKREYRTALTGLSLLALVGAGHTHRAGEHRGAVKDAARFLVGRQRPDGSFHPRGVAAEEREMYGNAMALLALSELYRATRSQFLRRPVEDGLRYIESSQTAYAGWRYQPRDRGSDTSVTGWQLLAVVAAGRTGLEVNPATLLGVRNWLDRMTEPRTYRVGYDKRGRGSVGMTATGLAMRLLMADRLSEPEVKGGAEILAANLPSWPAPGEEGPPGNPPDICYWYFGTLACSRLARDPWRDWSLAVRKLLLDRQAREGREAGSWPPPGRWGRVGGRVLTTATCALVLELAQEYETAFR